MDIILWEKGAYFHNQRMGTVSCNVLCVQTCTGRSADFLLWRTRGKDEPGRKGMGGRETWSE